MCKPTLHRLGTRASPCFGGVVLLGAGVWILSCVCSSELLCVGQQCLGSVPVRLLATAPHWVQGDGFSPVCVQVISFVWAITASLFAPLVLPHSMYGF